MGAQAGYGTVFINDIVIVRRRHVEIVVSSATLDESGVLA